MVVYCFFSAASFCWESESLRVSHKTFRGGVLGRARLRPSPYLIAARTEPASISRAGLRSVYRPHMARLLVSYSDQSSRFGHAATRTPHAPGRDHPRHLLARPGSMRVGRDPGRSGIAAPTTTSRDRPSGDGDRRSGPSGTLAALEKLNGNEVVARQASGVKFTSPRCERVVVVPHGVDGKRLNRLRSGNGT
jgi:hypothetical protein